MLCLWYGFDAAYDKYINIVVASALFDWKYKKVLLLFGH